LVGDKKKGGGGGLELVLEPLAVRKRQKKNTPKTKRESLAGFFSLRWCTTAGGGGPKKDGGGTKDPENFDRRRILGEGGL